MKNLVHQILLSLPPELAHSLGKFALGLYQWFWFSLLRKSLPQAPSILIPSVGVVAFRSRVGVAAGFDKDAEIFPALGLLGAGFVEVGTVTPLAQTGNAKPRLFRPASKTLINHMGFNNRGLVEFRASLALLRPLAKGLPVFANIGKNKGTDNASALNDYRKGFEALKGYVDGFVVNLSSPNTPDLVALQSEEFLTSLAKVTPVGMPVWIKFSPDLDNDVLSKLAAVVGEEARFSGVVVTNTSREMAEEVFHAPQGGLSGRPLFSRALECVSIVRQAIGKKTVVGVGGVFDLNSAKQMRRAGADLVEVYTALAYRGPDLLKELSSLD